MAPSPIGQAMPSSANITPFFRHRDIGRNTRRPHHLAQKKKEPHPKILCVNSSDHGDCSRTLQNILAEF